MTDAEQALLTYMVNRSDGWTGVVKELTEAVRAEQTWPGAVTEDDAITRYPEIWRATEKTWPQCVAAINRARADGIKWAAENAHRDVRPYILGLLPKGCAE